MYNQREGGAYDTRKISTHLSERLHRNVARQSSSTASPQEGGPRDPVEQTRSGDEQDRS